MTPVSAVFLEPVAVEQAIVGLTSAGIPRDVIDVVVSPQAARKHYPGIRTAPVRQTVRFAAIGALTQLSLSIIISLVMISFDEFAVPGATAWVQLLGPNMGTIGGAVVGAVFGFFQRRSPKRYHARAAEEPDAIVIVVRARDTLQAEALQRQLARLEGNAPRMEPAF